MSNLPLRLIATHVTFKPVIQTISRAGVLKIELQPLNFGINEVTVSAKNLRRQNLRMFKKHFIGPDINKEFKILNDSVLHFMTDEYNFHAYTHSPLIIENKYLGYTIKVLVKDFHLCKKHNISGEMLALKQSNGTVVSKLSGYFYYEPIISLNYNKNNKVEVNRLRHYFGSSRHFLKALYNNNLLHEGYKISGHPKTDSLPPISCSTVRKGVKSCSINSDSVKVMYLTDLNGYPLNLHLPYDQWRYFNSTILPKQSTFLLRKNGTSPNLNFEIKGPMGQRKMVNSLPNDYEPDY